MRKEYDFSNAKRAKDVPHLALLQAEAQGKTRITIMLDNDIIDAFREQAEQFGTGYQTEINRALRQLLQQPALTLEAVRQVFREEMRHT